MDFSTEKPGSDTTPSPAWCLRSEGVSSVLLGASSPEQLMENLGAIQASNPCPGTPLSDLGACRGLHGVLDSVL